MPYQPPPCKQEKQAGTTEFECRETGRVRRVGVAAGAGPSQTDA